MRNLTIFLVNLALLISQSEGCQKKVVGIFKDEEPSKEVHHHHYNNGEEIPPPAAIKSDRSAVYGPEDLTVEAGEPVKHVVVIQAAPPPPPPEEAFESIWPKKLHPKHFLKHHIHKLRSRFRSLLDDKHGHGHGFKHGGLPPPPPPPPVAIYPQKVALPALKVPLVQVEAYKAAEPGYYHNGQKVKAVAYVSPDGYQPAVVVKQKHVHPPQELTQAHPPGQVFYATPAPTEVYQATPPQPQPVAYYNPQPQPQQVVYQPQPQPQPVAYQPQPQPVAYQQQPQPVAYQHQPQPQPVAYQHQPQPQPVVYQQSYQPQPHPQPQYSPQPQTLYSNQGPPQGSNYGPQGYQPSQPIYASQQGQYQPSGFFGQSSQQGFSDGNPYSSIDSSSSFFK